MERVKFKNSENCFNYIVNVFNNKKTKPDDLSGYNYNEAVFLKDLNDDGIEINEGFKKLKELKKPLPFALLFVYDGTSNCEQFGYDYKIELQRLKYNFTSDTIVIYAHFDYKNDTIISFDSFRTLSQMPGYDDV